MNDAFAQLDAMAEAGPQPDAAPAAGQAGPDKPELDTKPAEQPKPGEKPAEQPLEPAALRKAYDETKGKVATLEKELADLKAKPAEDPEKKKLGETLAERDKRLAALEEEMRYTNYEKSQDYQDKYWKPFESAYNAGRQKAAALKAVNADTGETRQGAAEDFDTLMKITDDDAAADKAYELFGQKAPMVLWHREKVQDLNGQRVNALDTFRKEGTARDQQRAEQHSQSQKQLASQWEAETKGAVEKYPQWFKPVEGDAEDAKFLGRGMELADAAFNGGVIRDAETGQFKKLGADELMKLHAAMRNKAGAFDALVHRLGKATKELKAAQTRLKEFEKSEPGAGDGRGARRGTSPTTMDSVLSGMDKFAT